jgi:hypothetical protein
VGPYDPGAWHDFATAFAGASGALLGLAFLAISFNLGPILAKKNKTLPGRAVETLAFFAYPLAGSLLIEVPGLSPAARRDQALTSRVVRVTIWYAYDQQR